MELYPLHVASSGTIHFTNKKPMMDSDSGLLYICHMSDIYNTPLLELKSDIHKHKSSKITEKNSTGMPFYIWIAMM